ncbi:MAG TPA: Gldg family protein [Sandaracinaceae bacterium LLY-WYZ-13_1]|nr:Gldg family protein [Sandaracinaceae bacterium LLY-WYZ-13_1]
MRRGRGARWRAAVLGALVAVAAGACDDRADERAPSAPTPESTEPADEPDEPARVELADATRAVWRRLPGRTQVEWRVPASSNAPRWERTARAWVHALNDAGGPATALLRPDETTERPAVRVRRGAETYAWEEASAGPHLEYRVARLLARAADPPTRLGWFDPGRRMGRARAALRGYRSEEVTLAEAISPDLDAVVVASPGPLTPARREHLRRYLETGGSVALLGPGVDGGGTWPPTRVRIRDPGLAPLLGEWGVRLSPRLVLAEMSLRVPTPVPGGSRLPLPYPPAPVVCHCPAFSVPPPSAHRIALDAGQVPFPLALAIELDAREDVDAEVVLRAERAWLEEDVAEAGPHVPWTPEGRERSTRPMLIALTRGAGDARRRLVVAASPFADDAFVAEDRGYADPLALLANVVDWLALPWELVSLAPRRPPSPMWAF